MTVIVASVAEGLMASDSMCLDHDETWFPATKIHRVGNRLVGLAGTITDTKPLLEWLRKPAHKRGEAPEIEEDTSLLILSPGLLQTWDAGNGFYTIESGVHAIGSGGSHARVALLAGASVKEAARLTVQVVSTCAGPIVTRRLRRTA